MLVCEVGTLMFHLIGSLSLNREVWLIWFRNKTGVCWVWEAYFRTTAYLIVEQWRVAHTGLNDYSYLIEGTVRKQWMLAYLNVKIILKNILILLKWRCFTHFSLYSRLSLSFSFHLLHCCLHLQYFTFLCLIRRLSVLLLQKCKNICIKNHEHPSGRSLSQHMYTYRWHAVDLIQSQLQQLLIATFGHQLECRLLKARLVLEQQGGNVS